MKKGIFFALLLLMITVSVKSQQNLTGAPTIAWQKCLGGSESDEATVIQQTQDSGYIIAGFSSSNNYDVSGNHKNSDDYWIVKLNKDGTTIEWQRSLGGMFEDRAYSIQQTRDGGYIVAGRTLSRNGHVTGNNGLSDCWIVKLSAKGHIAWQKNFGGSDYDQAYAIQQTTDGGYIFCGSTSSNNGDVSGNHGKDDMWVVKVDRSGNLKWQKCFGGTSYDRAHSVIQASDGGYVICGITGSNDGDVSGNHGINDCWVIKIDKNGNIIWQKTYGGSLTEGAGNIIQMKNGGYVMCGYTLSNDKDVSGNHGEDDIWVVKMDSLGAINSQKCFGGKGSDGDFTGEWPIVNEAPDHGFIICGVTNSNDGDIKWNNGFNHGLLDMLVIRTNDDLDIEWVKTLGGTGWEEPHDIHQTKDMGYMVAGSTRNSNDGDVSGNHGNGTFDYWIVKLNPDLTFARHMQQQKVIRQLIFYPNPAGNNINVNVPADGVLQIITLNGNIMISQKVNAGNVNINTAGLMQGNYTIKLITTTQSFAGALIKQ